MPRTYDETYTMRSTFFQLLGKAGKTLAEAYTQADLENQAAIKDMVFEAMVHSLVEHHRYPREEIAGAHALP